MDDLAGGAGPSPVSTSPSKLGARRRARLAAAREQAAARASPEAQALGSSAVPTLARQGSEMDGAGVVDLDAHFNVEASDNVTGGLRGPGSSGVGGESEGGGGAGESDGGAAGLSRAGYAL
jgi:hypothetical protein